MIGLREVRDEDLDVLFAYQQEPEACWMAAFTAEDPGDREAFDAHWARIRADPAVTIRCVVDGDRVVGHVASFDRAERREVTYWIGRAYWGRGIATQALRLLLEEEPVRPLLARVAHDNRGSMRVLHKCGFEVIGREHGVANARGAEIEELVLLLG